MILSIGSGSANKLLSGKKTKGFAQVLQYFVADDREHWNSMASPIDALRIGALLEIRYLDYLGDGYYTQYKAVCDEFDCLVSSLDFAKIEKGEVVDFDELKTIFFTEFIDLIEPLKNMNDKDRLEVVKKRFKSNYKQIQFQLLCSGLDSANLVFLSVESYDDDENYLREITEKDFLKIRVKRDSDIIDLIKERASFFQSIKNQFV